MPRGFQMRCPTSSYIWVRCSGVHILLVMKHTKACKQSKMHSHR
uniref:Uncharacterized protein n=1 Tax=Anguilla anguilla TaxID=7936 RepID=A0A0E9U509_ANGAN